MATANYVLLEKITVGAAGASSVTFSGIPQTGYTDLKIVASLRADYTGVLLRFNSDAGANYTWTLVEGNGTTASSMNQATLGGSYLNSIYSRSSSRTTDTANTFGSYEAYVPNYTSSSQKSVSIDGVFETNATGGYDSLTAGKWTGTSAITSLTLLADSGNFVQYSTFYLYGVAKLGTTPAIQPYATGGDTIMTDGTYWYHAFKSSGTFTPAKALSCDVLVVAGGGSGSGDTGGGGGAGGVIAFASQSFASGTGYTATIGAGGTGNTSNGSNGSNSTFASLTAAVGGGRGGATNGTAAGAAGGSGGGTASFSSAAGGTATSGQGNNGGAGGGAGGAAGGGGAGAVGGAGSGATAGAGGAGTTSVTNWGALTTALTAVGMGVSNYIAGGGGGNAYNGAAGAQGAGGSGGGGGAGVTLGTAGTANTGSGGGAGSNPTSTGGNGGSGMILVRYAI